MYIDKTLREYVELTSMKISAPGGGSVLALVSSLGNALSEMAINFSRDKNFYSELDLNIKDKVEISFEKLKNYRNDIDRLIDLDTIAFNSVLKAYKLSKDDENRNIEIEKGYIEALEIPLACFRYSLESLKLQSYLVKYSDKTLISDSAIGAILSYSAMEGSIYNIRINLKGINNLDYKNEILEEIENSLKYGLELKNIILGTADIKL